MGFFSRPVLELIDLVFDLEGSAKVGRRGKGLVFNAHDHIGVPGMPIEIASYHLPVLRPFVKRIRGAVHSDESLPVPDEVHESLFPFFGNRQLPGSVEHHRIVVLEILGADRRTILSHGGFKIPEFLANLRHDLLCKRDDGVLESRRVRQKKELARPLRGAGDGEGEKQKNRNEQEPPRHGEHIFAYWYYGENRL